MARQERLPPLAEQRSMGQIDPKDNRYKLRNILAQALALLEDDMGIGYEDSALHSRWVRMKEAQYKQIRSR